MHSENNFSIYSVSVGNAASEFTAASQAMIDSPTVQPQVKAIFQEFLAAIDELKPCTINADLLCMRKILVNCLRAMEQGVKLSQGPLKQLFQKMLNIDLLAIAKSGELLRNVGRQADQITDSTLGSRTKLIQQYLHKFQ